MYANNEIGVIHPIRKIGEIAREKGVFLHVDAAQAAGKIPVDVERDCIDLLSLTAHKIYGPKGIGVLYVRRRNPRVELAAQMHGGGHERGLRSGTLNVPGIVGLGKACELCRAEMEKDSARLAALRDRLKKGIEARLENVTVNGSMEHRLPHNLHLSFAGVDGESLLMGLDDVAVSSGSACTTANPEPSHVLKALGLRDDLAHGSLRFGLGRFTKPEEIDHAIERVVQVVTRLRQLSPVY
jgi:cysteine desulfurase